MPTKLTSDIIAAAIEGFESQKQRIDGQIAELRQMLDGGPTKPVATPEVPARKRKKLSASTRRRMKEAQQRRWAASKGESEAPPQATTEVPKPKRKLSEAGRKAISVATKKRWAAVRAKREKPKPAAAKKTAR
jgi:hypothetical protein